MFRDGPHWLLAWGAASLLLLGLQLGTGFGLPIAFAAGLLLGLVLTVALRPRRLVEMIPAGSRGELVRKLITEAEPSLAQLRATAAQLRAPGVGARFAHMADVADAVMKALVADPARIAQGQRLLTYLLPRAAQLADGLRLVEAQAAPDPERQSRLATMTARLDEAFTRTRDSLAEPELRALDLELRLLEDALAETDTQQKVAR